MSFSFDDKNCRILAVDDMSLSRVTAQRMLKDLGFLQVDVAENGQVAWDMIVEAFEKKQSYALIISDWMMPVVDGLGLLQKIKASGWAVVPPLLLMTAESDMANVYNAIKSGIAGYIRKPITVELLKEALENISRGGAED